MKKIYSILGFVLLVSNICFAQEKPNDYIKKLLKGKGISMRGSIDFQTRFYNAYQTINRQPPLFYRFSGNMLLDIGGQIKIPVSISYTNQNIIYQGFSLRNNLPTAQSFNRLQFKPKYKSNTFYIGTTSLNFSNYTNAGFRVNGVGYEYNNREKRMFGSVLAGQFMRPIRLDSITLNPLARPSYRRLGVSSKLGIRGKSNQIELNILHSSDIQNSLPYKLDIVNIFPEKNLAISVHGEKYINSKLLYSGEIARSSILRLDLSTLSTHNSGNLLINIFSKDPSTKTAYNSKLKYVDKNWSVEGEYSRVDPSYRTHGAYFFNNDLETIAVKTKRSSNLYSIWADGGVQRTNLNGKQVQATKRFVYNIGTQFNIKDKFIGNFSTSTFSTYTNFQNQFAYLRILDPYTEIDTLNYRQSNRLLQGNIMVQLPSGQNYKNSIVFNTINQLGREVTGGRALQSSMYSQSVAYSFQSSQNKHSFTMGVNHILNDMRSSGNKMKMAYLSFQNSIIQGKVSAMSGISFTSISSFSEFNRSNGSVINLNFGLISKIKKDHNLSLNLLVMKNSGQLSMLPTSQSRPSFTETQLNINYSYGFKLFDFKVK